MFTLQLVVVVYVLVGNWGLFFIQSRGSGNLPIKLDKWTKLSQGGPLLHVHLVELLNRGHWNPQTTWSLGIAYALFLSGGIRHSFVQAWTDRQQWHTHRQWKYALCLRASPVVYVIFVLHLFKGTSLLRLGENILLLFAFFIISLLISFALTFSPKHYQRLCVKNRQTSPPSRPHLFS